MDENLDKLEVFNFINRSEKDLRSLSYDTLVLLHIIMIIERSSTSDKLKIFEIIDDEISKRQQAKQRF